MAALWLLLGVTGAAQAERADRFKPLNFAADSLRYDDQKQVNVLSGNVEITKGTLVLRAGRVEVRQSPDGHQSALAIAGNQPAFFRQKREGLDEHFEGEAERLEYDARADTMKLTGNAVIRRYRGALMADEVAGQSIVYDNARETFVVDGATSSAPAGRVRGVLSPRSADEPAAGGARR